MKSIKIHQSTMNEIERLAAFLEADASVIVEIAIKRMKADVMEKIDKQFAGPNGSAPAPDLIVRE